MTLKTFISERHLRNEDDPTEWPMTHQDALRKSEEDQVRDCDRVSFQAPSGVGKIHPAGCDCGPSSAWLLVDYSRAIAPNIRRMIFGQPCQPQTSGFTQQNQDGWPVENEDSAASAVYSQSFSVGRFVT